MTTYQRLKAENLKLKQQLDIVCNEPNTMEAMRIKGHYKLNRLTEIAIFSGSRTNAGTQFNGLLKQFNDSRG